MTNPLLADWTTSFALPPFAEITDDDFAPAFAAAMDEARANIARIAGNSEPPTFANTIEALEASVERICHRLRNFGEREVDSRKIGELVMEELRQLDEVAYVRFASVYHRFQDVDEFRDQLEELDVSRRRDPSTGQLPLLPGAGQGKARK